MDDKNKDKKPDPLAAYLKSLDDPTWKKIGRPSRALRSDGDGLKPGEIRKTYIVSERLNEKLRYIAAQEDMLIKDIVRHMMIEFIERYEAENGEIIIEF